MSPERGGSVTEAVLERLDVPACVRRDGLGAWRVSWRNATLHAGRGARRRRCWPPRYRGCGTCCVGSAPVPARAAFARYQARLDSDLIWDEFSGAVLARARSCAIRMRARGRSARAARIRRARWSGPVAAAPGASDLADAAYERSIASHALARCGAEPKGPKARPLRSIPSRRVAAFHAPTRFSRVQQRRHRRAVASGALPERHRATRSRIQVRAPPRTSHAAAHRRNKTTSLTAIHPRSIAAGFETALLHGVTGSGKTYVYIACDSRMSCATAAPRDRTRYRRSHSRPRLHCVSKPRSATASPSFIPRSPNANATTHGARVRAATSMWWSAHAARSSHRCRTCG